MKVDRLFLVKNCPSCATIKAHLNWGLIESDKFFGKDGQRLFVFNTLTVDGGRDLLDRYGLVDKYAPLLMTHDGKLLEEAGAIIAYMMDNKMI
jgi:hypothetical protein